LENKKVWGVVLWLFVGLQLCAAEDVHGTQQWWRRIVPGSRTVAAMTAVALLAASAHAAANSEPSLQMATVYYTEGGECAVRCATTEADWLGPIYAVCADAVGCSDMFLQGALGCFINPEYVSHLACSITHKNATFS